MIISRIIGGLGNQMFQYAAGRAAALKAGDSFLVDASDYSRQNIHNGFELKRVFNLPISVARDSDIKNVLGFASSYQVRRILSKNIFKAARPRSLIIEPHFHYSKVIEAAPKKCYLDGWWQSEKYFSDFSSQIKFDFKFSDKMSIKNAHIADSIVESNAVSVHIRRGDYLSSISSQGIHSVCTSEYYDNAIKYLSERISGAHFFIFSDDVPWTKKYIKIKFPCTYVENNFGLESYNDMRLMSLCQNNIIANSSFSWWAAWLNSYKSKIVIAPKVWFKNKFSTDDLLPQSWIRL